MSGYLLRGIDMDDALNAIDHAVSAMDDTLNDCTNQQFYSDDEWAEMKEACDQWRRLLRKLTMEVSK